MNQPSVSVIIVNYCGKDLLEQSLPKLFETNYENFDVILVDNNSNDNSIEFVKKNFPQVKVIKLNKNYGYAEPNNMAAKTADGKYLVFLNNDTIVTKNWLTELVKTLEDDKMIAMAQSLILKKNGSVDSSGDFIDTIGRAYSMHDLPSKKRYVLSCKGACMITRRDLFLDFGGFDKNYFASFEDVEIGWRTWLWGYKAIVVPESIVYHLGGKTIEKISKEIAFHGAKNNILLRLTNFDLFDSLRSILSITLIIFVRKLFGISLVKNIEQEWNIPDMGTLFSAMLWVFKNQRLVLEKRKVLKSRQIRKNSDLKKLGLITNLSKH